MAESTIDGKPVKQADLDKLHIAADAGGGSSRSDTKAGQGPAPTRWSGRAGHRAHQLSGPGGRTVPADTGARAMHNSEYKWRWKDQDEDTTSCWGDGPSAVGSFAGQPAAGRGLLPWVLSMGAEGHTVSGFMRAQPKRGHVPLGAAECQKSSEGHRFVGERPHAIRVRPVAAVAALGGHWAPYAPLGAGTSLSRLSLRATRLQATCGG